MTASGKVALVHYHMGAGGVAVVIAMESRAMTRAGIKHVIICGMPVAAEFRDLPVRMLAALGYEEGIPEGKNWLEEARRVMPIMCEMAAEVLGGEPEIWHFHNHSLARHPLMPHLVALLALRPTRLWLHLHDLAEEGRPQHFAHLGDWRQLYPVAARIQYRFLNRRDRDRLVNAGLPENHAHVLPNPVNPITLRDFTPRSGIAVGAPPLILYPVRGIRRKNLGELLLLAILMPKDGKIAITQEPTEAEAKQIHDSWRDFAVELELPVEFGVVGRLTPNGKSHGTLDDWRGAASHWVTTSIAEGFGMVFLEAAAAGKPLFGRDLPHITSELAKRGIPCEMFYQQILVPVEWVGKGRLRQHREAAMRKMRHAYGLDADSENCPPSALHDCEERQVDFGNLPECLQRCVLKFLASEPCERHRVVARTRTGNWPMQHWLAEVFATLGDPAERFAPQERCFSEDGHLEEILEAGVGMASAQAEEPLWLDAQRVLKQYQGPASFQFLLAPQLDATDGLEAAPFFAANGEG